MAVSSQPDSGLSTMEEQSEDLFYSISLQFSLLDHTSKCHINITSRQHHPSFSFGFVPTTTEHRFSFSDFRHNSIFEKIFVTRIDDATGEDGQFSKPTVQSAFSSAFSSISYVHQSARLHEPGRIKIAEASDTNCSLRSSAILLPFSPPTYPHPHSHPPSKLTPPSLSFQPTPTLIIS